MNLRVDHPLEVYTSISQAMDRDPLKGHESIFGDLEKFL